jgi:glyoxylase-like metal-dependent hydrolase (beta-lactamase superfamily II)
VIGSLKRILQENQVPVYAHHIEFPYMEGALPYPGRKKAAQSVQPGVAQALTYHDDGQLAPISGLTPYLTPGHSPGHVVYYHEQDRVLLAGDLFTSKGGKLYRPMPMYTADMAEAVKSSEIVALLRPERLEVCHGNPVLKPAEHIESYQTETLRKYVIPKNPSLGGYVLPGK